MDPTTARGTAPVGPDADQEPAPAATTRSRLPRGWLIVFAVLAVAFVVSAVVLIMVASPPAYEPVPVPSVDRV